MLVWQKFNLFLYKSFSLIGSFISSVNFLQYHQCYNAKQNLWNAFQKPHLLNFNSITFWNSDTSLLCLLFWKLFYLSFLGCCSNLEETRRAFSTFFASVPQKLHFWSIVGTFVLTQSRVCNFIKRYVSLSITSENIGLPQFCNTVGKKLRRRSLSL